MDQSLSNMTRISSTKHISDRSDGPGDKGICVFVHQLYPLRRVRAHQAETELGAVLRVLFDECAFDMVSRSVEVGLNVY
jgi:hypothetical protein